MTKALEALSDAYNLSYDSAMKNTQANVDSFNTTKSEIKNLESEAQQYKETLSSLGDKYEVDLSGIESIDEIITKLRQSGKLELTDEAELVKIDSQNAALERQLAIKEKLVLSQQKQAAADARDTLGRGEQSVAQQVEQFVPGGKKKYQGQVNNVNIIDAVNENVLAIQKYEDAIAEAEKAMKDLDPDSKAWKEQEKNINSYNEAIKKLTDDLNTKEADLTTLLSAFSVDGEGLVALGGFEKEFEAVKDAIENLNNMNLSPAKKELAKIESFFDGSSGKNLIKEKLQESVNSGKDLTTTLKEMGLTLSDIGVDSVAALSSYFTKTTEEAENAKKTVQDYAKTVADVEAAGETVNQDDSWTNFSEAYKTANELLKEGKTGVDDFQSVAALLNPAKVKELAEKGGKYTADAYEEAFREVKEIADRWFSEDETKSMENFVNDFKKAGLFDVDIDDKGLWDIETKFKSTAEAAKEYGISVEAVETMLQGLSAYGYEFDEVLFSGDALDRYQENLTKIKNLYESMGEGSSKDTLGEMIGNWDSELEKYKEDLDSLSEPQIVQIEFQYDLTQIEADLEKIRNKQESGAELGRTDYAEWINTYDSKYAKQKEGFGLDEVEIKAVTISDDAVEKAREELAKAVESGDETGIIEAQVKLIAAQESRDALLESFNKWNLEQEVPITADSGVEEVEAAWKEFTSTPQVIKLEGKVTNEETVKTTLEGLAEGSTIKYTADVNGVATEVTAIKNQDGSITYTADINNVTRTLAVTTHTDGTVTYTPITTEVDKYNYDQDGTVFYTGKFPDKAPTLYGRARYTVTYRNDGTLPSENIREYATGTMLSPAHKDGTAYNVLNTLPAFADGNVALDKNQRALVNEECINGHSESIVRDGVWRLIPGGAHLENLKKGDIIFSAQQTEDLLRHGKTPGHARAYAQGTVLAPAYRLPGGKKNNKSNKSNKNNKTTPPKTIVDTTEKTTKQLEEAFKEFEKLFDWVEVRLDRLGRDSQNAEDAIERATDLAGTLSKTSTAISKVNKERDAAARGADEYLVQAKKVAKQTGLSEAIQKKIHNGSIRISDYGEQTQKKIQEYQKWYEKYLECSDQVLECEDRAVELALSRLDKINEYYEAINSVNESLINLNDAKLDWREAKGYSETNETQRKILQSSLDEAKDIKSITKKNLDKYQNEFYSQVKKGNLVKGSVPYNERLAELNNLKAAYYEASTAVIEHSDALREIKYIKLNNAIEKFERAADRIQNKIDLAETRDQKVSEDTYKSQMTNNNNEINKLYELRNKKKSEQSKYAVNSTKYQELAKEISDYDNQINDLLINNESIKDKIIEARLKPLEDGVEALQNVRSELDDFRDLFNEEMLFDKDTGELTGEGVANIYLIEQAMISAKQEVADYTKGLEKLQQNYQNGNISQKEFNEKNEEYRQGIRNAISDTKEYSDVLVDLYLTQMNKENELLQEVIEKRKEALRAKADYYDYNRSITSKSREVNTLKAEIAALEGVKYCPIYLIAGNPLESYKLQHRYEIKPSVNVLKL